MKKRAWKQHLRIDLQLRMKLKVYHIASQLMNSSILREHSILVGFDMFNEVIQALVTLKLVLKCMQKYGNPRSLW